MKILIADDSELAREVLKDYVTEWGYDPVFAEDGNQAWDILSGGDPPRLALVDWVMPGMDGITLCRMLKETAGFPFIYLILITSKSTEEDIVTGLDAGADDFLSKPTQPGELRSRLAVGVRLLDYQNQLQKEIAEHKKTGEELRKTKELAETANRAKSVFLANMSHEIRTPMNAILGYTQILLRDKNLNAEQTEAMKIIESSGNHLLEMINDILDISKIEAGHMDLHSTSFDLNKLIASLADMFQFRCSQKQLGWRIERLDSAAIWVLGDEGKLRQVLINLLGNAVKFTEAGEVLLRITSEQADHYLFEVIDTGAGISPENRTMIFQPFRQDEEGLKKGGTGLGLAIAKKQVALMGGELALDSTPGKGSRFFFDLHLPPAAGQVEAGTKPDKTISRLAEGCHLNALVVDDVRENRTMLSKMLRIVGADVVEAENGRTALEKIHARIPDIVFLDMRMPEMDGTEIIARIQEEFGLERIKIVIATATVFRHQREKFFQLGGHAVVWKPFRCEDIYDCLKKLLGMEFDYEEESPGKTTGHAEPNINFSKTRLPENILLDLKKAAEFGNVTRLAKTLDNLSPQDTATQAVVARLKTCVGRCDVEGITNILGKIREA